MTTNPTIEALKPQLLPILKQFGVTKAAVFGSFARNEAGPESDLDLLFQPPSKFTLFDLFKLEDAIKEKVKREVDLAVYGTLRKQITDKVMREAVDIL